MKKFILLLVIAAGMGTAAFAQVDRNNQLVKVRITPTKMSWDYDVNETIKMEVNIEKNELPLDGIGFRYEAGPEMIEPVMKKEGKTKRGGVVLDLGKMSKPGFFTLNVSVEVDGVRYNQWKTVSVGRDKIEPTVKMPADFTSYWKAQIEQDRKIAMAPTMRLLAERCTSNVDVYEISYVYTPQGGRFYGILCIPKAPGKYPAVLKVPGAGVRHYNGSIWLAEKGYITLEVGIHGIPVTLDPVVYERLRNGILNRYNTMNIESRDNYYYNKVYRGCRKAVDFIFTLPEFDGENIGVSGGSQGGALAVVVGALDNRIKCVSSFYPALSDMTGYVYGRAGGWPHILKEPKGNVFNKPEFIETLSYYDVVNFARILEAPVFYSMGYNDKVCPPTSTFSVYNATRSPKELFVAEETAHWTFPEQNAVADKYMDDILKKK